MINLGKKTKQRPSVQFSDEVATHKFEPHSYEVGLSIWYNPEEQAEFQIRNSKILLLMSQMTAAEMEERVGETTRGLESHLERNSNIVSNRIKRSIAVVKAMQELEQKQNKPLKPNAIANAYARAAGCAARDAQLLGTVDATFVSDHVRPKDYVPATQVNSLANEQQRNKTKRKSSTSRPTMRRMFSKLGSSSKILTRAFRKRVSFEPNSLSAEPVTE